MPRARFSEIATKLLLWPVQLFSRLTPDGGLFLALALLCGLASIGANRWSNIPLLMCLVMLSLWLLAIWRGSHSLRGISLKRAHAERVFANETFTVSLTASNRARLPVAGLVFSEELEADNNPVPAASGTAPAVGARPNARAIFARGRTFVTVLPGAGAERARYTLTIRRRGIYRFGPTRIDTVFPLGFFLSSAMRSTAGRVIVYPRLGDVDTSFFREMELALQLVRRSQPSRAEEDIRGLRDFRRGDNPKWIHWRSSARTPHKLLVKEFEEPQARRVMLVLDTNLQRLGAQRFAAFELAISFAATVARELARRGCEVECVALQPHNRMARVTISRERRNLEALLEMLAGLRREDNRTLADLSEHIRRHSLHHVYVLVLGLGSLRAKANLSFLNAADNVVRTFDARGDDFRHVFRRASGSKEDSAEEDLLLGMGDEEASDEDVAQWMGTTAGAADRM